MTANIRKIVVQVDETRIEMGRPVDPPTRRALAMAVIANPCAGRYVDNLDELIAIGEELGGLLGRRCVQALGIEPGRAESYGKAAIVGEAGEIEHAAAILHPKLGAPLRAAVEKGAALVPSAKKRGGLGTAIDVPLGHKDAAFVRSHFDAMEARVADAPRADEIVVAVVVTDSGRPLARVGGLTAAEPRAKTDCAEPRSVTAIRHRSCNPGVRMNLTSRIPPHRRGRRDRRASRSAGVASHRRRASIKIGEINSYKAQPAFLEPYKKGMELAVDEVNAAGGVNGRKLELITRDDNANPGDAVRVAEELVSREKRRRADRHLPVAHRPGAHRLRQAEEVLLPRRRAADRQDRLGQRQPLHVPAAARRPTCRPRCWCPRPRQAEEEALGRRLPELRVRAVGGRRPSRSC